MYKPYLNTFLSVCDTGSFTKAAAALYITPSAVIQQINALEKDLAVTLFERSPKGVHRTEAGEYLYIHGKELIRQAQELRRTLVELNSEGKDICIGTSLMEKCRLLYDLWVLFSEQEKGYEIKMMNIDSGHNIPGQTDLIESVNGGMPWARDWEFLEICRVPFAFAFQRSHPLLKKKKITLDDLKGETVVSINPGTSSEIIDMLETLKAHEIPIVFTKGSGSSILWECAFHPYVLVAPACWDDILINMEMRHCSWECAMPYGIFHRPEPKAATRRFLDFIRNTYTAGNPQGIVPVLSEWV